MELTNEDFELFKNKLLNEYSEEELDSLMHKDVESIREYIKADYNPVYMDIYPILDDINDKLKNSKEKHRVNICIPCEIKAVLTYLFKEIMFEKIKK
jgi:hypothetical protein